MSKKIERLLNNNGKELIRMRAFNSDIYEVYAKVYDGQVYVLSREISDDELRLYNTFDADVKHVAHCFTSFGKLSAVRVETVDARGGLFTDREQELAGIVIPKAVKQKQFLGISQWEVGAKVFIGNNEIYRCNKPYTVVSINNNHVSMINAITGASVSGFCNGDRKSDTFQCVTGSHNYRVMFINLDKWNSVINEIKEHNEYLSLILGNGETTVGKMMNELLPIAVKDIDLYSITKIVNSFGGLDRGQRAMVTRALSLAFDLGKKEFGDNIVKSIKNGFHFARVSFDDAIESNK